MVHQRGDFKDAEGLLSGVVQEAQYLLHKYTDSMWPPSAPSGHPHQHPLRETGPD